MSVRSNKSVLVDSGFWFALYTPRDQYNQRAANMASILDVAKVIVPWPTLYEALNTRFARNRYALERIESILQSPRAVLVDDSPYREDALVAVFHTSRYQQRALSFVDILIRSVLDDPNVRVDGLLTFNQEDFADICRKRRIEIL